MNASVGKKNSGLRVPSGYKRMVLPPSVHAPPVHEKQFLEINELGSLANTNGSSLLRRNVRFECSRVEAFLR